MTTPAPLAERIGEVLAKVVHWLGHVLFDIDCAVHVEEKTQKIFCKKCGRDVSISRGQINERQD